MKIRALLSACLLAAGLGACVCLCARVNTLNAHRMLITVIAVSTLSGWAAILLRRLVWAPARAEAAHTAGLENETTETYQGVLSAPGDVFFIPHGITAFTIDGVTADTGLDGDAGWYAAALGGGQTATFALTDADEATFSATLFRPREATTFVVR